MNIVLATGIYPPDIGGPATYVQHLAEELTKLGHRVTVVTFGAVSGKPFDLAQDRRVAGSDQSIAEPWKIITVSKSGGPLLRWWRYARVLRREASDADVLEAFSSVSVGVPMFLARLKHPFGSGQGKPKKILRLGGDFLWERYTDGGGTLGIRDWYKTKPRSRFFLQIILHTFDHIIFSSRFQRELTCTEYPGLPPSSVIENAFKPPEIHTAPHSPHSPFRLLFLGRFVACKNLPVLIHAMSHVLDCTLTLVGSGPMESRLRKQVDDLRLNSRVTFLPDVDAHRRTAIFDEQDLLVLPSLTEVSPNTPLEALACGLPSLITNETGLEDRYGGRIIRTELRTVAQVVQAIQTVRQNYASIASAPISHISSRSWNMVAREHCTLFTSLV